MAYLRLNKTWFETTYLPTRNTLFKYKFAIISDMPTNNKNSGGFGVYYTYNAAYTWCLCGNAEAGKNTFPLRFYCGGRYDDNYYTGYTYGKIVSVETTTSYCKLFDEDGVQLQNKTYSTNFSAQYPILIGQVYDTGSTLDLTSCVCDVYGLEIYENDVLIHNYQPTRYNGEACLYDTVDGVYLHADDPTKVDFISNFEPSKSSFTFDSTGGTQSFTLVSESGWSCSNPTWATIAPSSGEGDSTVTITVGEYTGTDDRSETITFTNAGGDTFDITIRQRKPSTGGYSGFYKGDYNITDMYLGETAIEYIYLGENIIFQRGAFVGLRVSPKSIEFIKSGSTSSISIRSSETWTVTAPDWITLSQSSGEAGKFTITATASDLGSGDDRFGTIDVETANYSATVSVEQKAVQYVTAIYPVTYGSNSSGYSIFSPIYPSSTSVCRVSGVFLSKNIYDVIAGGAATDIPGCSDNNDYRIFLPYGAFCFDASSARRTASTSYSTGTPFDITFGNYYIFNNRTSSYELSKTSYTTIPTTHALRVSLYDVKISEFQIWSDAEQQNLVFNGHAAIVDGVIGLYDDISNQLYTIADTSLPLTYDE